MRFFTVLLQWLRLGEGSEVHASGRSDVLQVLLVDIGFVFGVGVGGGDEEDDGVGEEEPEDGVSEGEEVEREGGERKRYGQKARRGGHRDSLWHGFGGCERIRHILFCVFLMLLLPLEVGRWEDMGRVFIGG